MKRVLNWLFWLIFIVATTIICAAISKFLDVDFSIIISGAALGLAVATAFENIGRKL